MSSTSLRYEQAHSEQNHDVGVASLAFSMHGTFLATAGLDGKVCVWDVEARQLFRTFVGKTAVLALAWLPNGEDTILVGYQDGNVTILSMTSFQDVVAVSYMNHGVA
ncbi:hypothetical protein GSI_01688 [Ganoderma sinense ZZ0214-1]|uniref:Uncharacterized protein n=1 Tax=Ganoderma sinense ZZ0214-1 TaxID=1077348 RepID=A0A2G8SR17_9APHY|nr:hypothetical protein GSI_01688 [Ganoderma sinense ZZ0214-1]